MQHLERKIILGVLEANKWNRRKAARSLDISYRTLLYKIKEVRLPEVQSSSFREVPGVNDFR
jgi:two-component system, NtrC family, response regulator AtoC